MSSTRSISRKSVLHVPDLTIEQLKSLEGLRSDGSVLQRLEGVDWSFEKEDTTYLAHDIHPYPCKFIPQIPANLIAALSVPGEVVWDPFGGSGTTAFEALRLGRRAVSTDANPVANVVTRAKCSTFTAEELGQFTQLAERLRLVSSDETSTEALISRTSNLSDWIPDIPHIEKWFHPQASRELAYLRREINEQFSGDQLAFAEACFSAIIVRSSWQDGETRYASRPRDFVSGEVLKMFALHLEHSIARQTDNQRILRFRSPIVETVDLRKLSSERQSGRVTDLEPGSADLIVTSPPYANVTDYYLYHRFRLYWLGYSPDLLGDCEIGSHLRHQRKKLGYGLYLDEMAMCLTEMFTVLRPGRLAVLVLGDSVFNGQLHDTTAEIARLAVDGGFSELGRIVRPVHATKRSFIGAARRAKTETLLVLKKPPTVINALLYPPPYKMYPYETALAEEEAKSLLGPSSVWRSEAGLMATIDPYKVDMARRLTFTHRVSLDGGMGFRTWQAVLENGDAESDRRTKDPKYVTHGIHPYKGKFYPQLAKSLFNLSQLEPGMAILDPFAGSGTVPLEAYLNGFRGVGIEINPLAVLIAQAKTDLPCADPITVDMLLSRFLTILDKRVGRDSSLRAFPRDCEAEIRSWFPSAVAEKISWLLLRIEDVPMLSVQEGLKVCLSSIVRSVSQQDPRDLRIRRRKQPIDDAPVGELMRKQVQELRRRLRDFASRSVYSPGLGPKALMIAGDATQLGTYLKAGIASHSVDAVVTSPPYATALPYIDTDRLSILSVLGMKASDRSVLEAALTGSREIRLPEKRKLEEELSSPSLDELGTPTGLQIVRTIHDLNRGSSAGFRRQNMAALLLRYLRDMRASMECINCVIVPGGSVFMVMGNNRTVAGGTEIVIDGITALCEIGQSIGWKLKQRIPISVTREDLPHMKHSITQNEVLWFVA